MIMCGDSAGMIHPLCGNGMSMAIQSAQIASKLILNYLDDKNLTRKELEKNYISEWNHQFSWRLKSGHFIAKLFRNDKIANFLLQILSKMPFLFSMWLLIKLYGNLYIQLLFVATWNQNYCLCIVSKRTQ